MVNFKFLLLGGITGLVFAVLSFLSSDLHGIQKAEAEINLNFDLPKLTFENNEVSQAVVSLYQSEFDKKEQLKREQEQKAVAKKVEVEKPEPKKFGLTEQQEASQKGKLTTLFSGEETIILKGIFSGDSNFAIMHIKNLRTNKVTVKKLVIGQSILGYNLNKLSDKSASLQKGENTVELSLFSTDT